MIARLLPWSLWAWFAAAVVAAGEAPMVAQSAREIPVAYDVDVVVVGGSTGAVSAAVHAAEAGAKVFLAAPRPYLGDDMTATLRLWLEPGETEMSPLGARIFRAPQAAGSHRHPRAMKFSYQADRPSAKPHLDTDPPSLLGDGRFGSAGSQSVQYDGDVTIVADLGQAQEIEEVRVMYYLRPVENGGSAFDVASVTVSTSDDQRTWKPAGELKKGPVPPEPLQDPCLTASAPLGTKARYVKLAVEKPEGVERMLLGEIELIGRRVVVETVKVEAPLPPVRPMHVKKTLDEALLEAGVEFLYSCYATDVLRDAAGQPCGIVMANRAGRQAVIARTIIDATDRAVVARLAGAEFRPYPGGLHTFKRTVIGGEVRSGPNVSARLIEPPFGGHQIIEYTLKLPMTGASYASFAAADQKARTMTYHPEQQFTSDVLFEVPPDAVRGEATAEGPWQGMDGLPLGAFRPKGVPHLYVLGACADVSREQAEKLLRPLALMDTGTRLGLAAAREAKSLAAPRGVHVPGKPPASPATEGDVKELLEGTRPMHRWPSVPQEAGGLPVLGRYDVVVIGGGTGGAPAGIAAGRQGAKTLVVEYLAGLGGVGTLGAISNYCAGNRVGFTATIPTMPERKSSWVIEQKMEWYRSELLKAGADVWFRTVGCGALVHDGLVKGAVVATPLGRGVVLAKVVIDTTGNADVAAAAGADCIYVDHNELAMQGTGLPPRNLGAGYTNTDFTITDETDMVDVWHMFVYAKNKYAGAFDQGQLIDTRERRCIAGEHTLTILDQVNHRTYPDTVVQANGGGYDTHGYTVDPYLLTTHPGGVGIVHIPYRCMLPKGLEGILVASLGLSAHRDAVPLIRMQPDIQNGGYAAGVAAAMAARADTLTRHIDVRALQKHLVEVGNLHESVLEQVDSYPIPPETVAAAVEKLGKDFRGLGAIFARPDVAVPLLREAYSAAEGEKKGQAAFVLAMLGDPAGLETLAAEVRAAPAWDEGWNYRGMGQFGSALSPLDKKIVALGRTGRREALPAILEKLDLLTVESDFSHHRAVALATESIADPAAAKPLFDLLEKPGMTGYVHSTVEIARELGAPGGTNAVTTRRESIRELSLARALYRCADYGGLGEKILRAYTKDLRGHFARHAEAVLKLR